jgi:hypothetical protein
MVHSQDMYGAVWDVTNALQVWQPCCAACWLSPPSNLRCIVDTGTRVPDNLGGSEDTGPRVPDNLGGSEDTGPRVPDNLGGSEDTGARLSGNLGGSEDTGSRVPDNLGGSEDTGTREVVWLTPEASGDAIRLTYSPWHLCMGLGMFACPSAGGAKT